ncbi:hypothetical protein [Microbacterium memoriense]|uniref:Uncharacterized protein n=1 Tax=Microbacterium memoriense TaxID=2978350 RepID=A0ABT2PFF7_9MICO|nr:hypothetical protein [Microbacterium memoriense]MCT9002608.1 hypothetical protein [Microbacterium memoriense]
MNVSISPLYKAYAAVEEYPQKAERDAAAAAAASAAAERTQQTERAELARTHAAHIDDAKRQTAAAVELLEARLRKIAQSASEKGVIPATSATAIGIPGFDETAATDALLGSLLLEQTQLERGLRDLEAQRLREAEESRARTNDSVTIAIALVAVLVVTFVGANVAGVLVALLSMMLIRFRLNGTPSAFMSRRAVSVPLITHDRRVRSAQTGVVGGLFMVVALSLALSVSLSVAMLGLPAGLQLVGLLPGVEALTGIVSTVTFWAGVVFGAVVFIVGATRVRAR